MNAMSKPETPRIINFVFNKPADYPKIYINGVYGGPTPRGDLHCHFFFEYPILPKEQSFNLKPEGELGDLIKTLGEDDKEIDPTVPQEEIKVNRDMRVCLIMKPDQAESIANWLLDKVKALKEQRS